MFETLKQNPWRLATLILAVVLLGFAAFSVFSGDDGTETTGSDVPVGSESGQGQTAPSQSDDPGSDDIENGGQTPSGEGGLIAVKVDNAPAARPQVGLNAAPLLVEHLVEGGITRFTAVYPGPDGPEVGPVRSLRPVDADLLGQLAPVAVTSGGRPWVVGEVEASGVDLYGLDFITFFLSGSNEDPHNTYVVVNWLYEFIAGDYQPVVGLPSGELPDSSGTATTIELPYGDIVYEWEQAFGYGRSQEGRSFQVSDEIDGPTSQLTHDTVVILHAAERPAGYTDQNEVPVFTWDVIGSGELLVFSGGEVFEGRWLRPAQEDGFTFITRDGLAFGLPEGRVYMAVVDRSLSVEYR